MRVYELARKYKMSSDEMVKFLQSKDFTITTHMSKATDEMIAAAADHLAPKPKGKAESVAEAEPVKKRSSGQLKTNLQSRLELVKKRMQMREEMARQKAEMLKNVVSAPERKTDPVRIEGAEPDIEEETEDDEVISDTLEATDSAVVESEADAKTESVEKVAANSADAPAKDRPADSKEIKPRFRDGEIFRPKLVSAAPATPPKPAGPARGARAAAEDRKKEVRPLGPQPRSGGKRRKRKKKKTREAVVDRKAVEANIKKTMAAMDGGAKKKRRRRDREDGDDDYVEPSREIVVSEFLTVAELANQIDHRPSEVVAKLMELGQMATINQRLDFDTIEMVALEFDYGVRMADDQAMEAVEEEDPEDTLQPRPPVVTIMGHVDHGKTSLLDYIRKSNVIAGEAGGITQHIGAYNVETSDGKRITYLDTPGHEAFSAMRARGAQVTDCVVLVVAATESVMPQTIEAIDHAKAAGVPIIVAINKIDLPEANPEKVRQQLTDHGLVAEEWGGQTIMVNISAKTGEGIEKLQEMITLQTELLELRARPDRLAVGRVLEAELDKGKGPIVNALIQRGTLNIGDPVVVGPHLGRVRALLDEREHRVDSVGPSTAIQLIGVSGVPQAGDSLVAYATDDEAQRVAANRAAIKREQDIRYKAGATVGDWARRIADGEIKELKVVIKGDVGGSVEALSDTLERIDHPEVKVNVIHRGVGRVAESDVILAAASEALVIAFHVVPDAKAREIAAREHVTIREYDIIYEAEHEMKLLLEGMLGTDVHEEVTGRVEVRELFKVPKVGTVAGCYVLDGAIQRDARVRVIRDGVVLNTDSVATLRRFKDDAREVSSGYECGIRLENFSDVKVGDQFEVLQEVHTARTLA